MNKISLMTNFFGEKERIFLESNDICVSLFKYDSGVAAIRLKNPLGEVILLPFQGQQVWSCKTKHRVLTMKSMIKEPVATNDYLSTYGGFLLHCGICGMGVPGDKDKHPLHGELPNAPYQKANLIIGSDNQGSYVAVSGSYEHIVAFNDHYVFEPIIKFYNDSMILGIESTLTNLKNSEMEYMYMAHINFRPVINSRIVSSAPCTPNSTRVAVDMANRIKSSVPFEEFKSFLEKLRREPKLHKKLTNDLLFDPEVIFYVDYLTDMKGLAYSLQILPDGSADYICHRIKELPKGVRWITRTPDQEALGLFLPATAEHNGYTAEKEKGNIKHLAAGASVTFSLSAGAINASTAEQVEKKILTILEQ